MPKLTDAELVDPAAAPVKTPRSVRSKHRSAAPGKARRSARGGAGQRPAAGKATLASSGIRPDSKQSKVIGLLGRAQGASVAEMMKATGWQAHSVRGVMSGALKQKLGLSIVSEKTAAGERRSRIEGSR